MTSNQYKVGSVSDILAQSCALSSSGYDKKLVDIFSNNKYKSKTITTTTKVTNNDKKTTTKIEGKEKLFAEDIPRKKKKDFLSNKDAASIRVQAKRKLKNEEEEEDDEDDSTEVVEYTKKSKKSLIKTKTVEELQPKKKKKILLTKDTDSVPQISQSSIENEDINVETKLKLKQKKKKDLKNVKDKKKKDKVKKFQGEAQNQEIIEAFEREQNNSGASDGSDEDDENDDDGNKKDVKKEEEISKKQKIIDSNTPKAKNPEHEARTVFVGNVPVNTKEKELNKLFERCGKIEAIRFRGGVPEKYHIVKKVAINLKKLNPNQYNLLAYIRFSNREEADKAVTELNGHEFKEHVLVVDNADHTGRDNKRAVFVGNLPLKVHDDEVYKFFKDCGKIDNVRIIRDSMTGLSKGFGYINFKEVDSVELALKKHGGILDGREIRVSKAVKKEKKPKEKWNHPKNNFKGNNNVKGNKPNKKFGALGRLEKKQQKLSPDKKSSNPTNNQFTGVQLGEKSKLKRQSRKPDRGALKKARIASQLTGVSSTQFIKKQNEKKKKKSFKKN